MTLIELFILAIGLSMDAFAVAICKGISLKKYSHKNGITIGLYFGIFQAIMPLLGYVLGSQFKDKINSFDHWIAFALLTLIGANMIKESFSKEDKNSNEFSDKLDFKNMIVLATATSIDALAVGVTFSILNINIINAILLIGITTFVLSFSGCKIGNVFGIKYKSKAELFGGFILIYLGIKILIEHL